MSEQQYMPRPQAQGNGLIVGIVAILGLLLLLAVVLGVGGWFMHSQVRQQELRAVEAAHRARAEAILAEEALHQAKQALAEAEAAAQSQPPEQSPPP
jgi:hypothetical protein